MRRGRIADAIGANRVVVALTTARLADALGNSILFVLLPLFVARLAHAESALPEPIVVGALISAYGFVNAGIQPLTGAWADHMNRRKPLIVGGLLIMAVATLSFAWARNLGLLFGIRLFQGVGVAMTVPTSMALMTTATARRSRGGSMGIYTTGRMIGLASGPILGGFLYDHLGFEPSFYIAAGLLLLGAILVHLWVNEVPAKTETHPDKPFRVFDRELLSPGILGVGIATFFMATAFTMIATLEPQFNERLKTGAFGFGIAFSALMVARLVFQVPFGWLSDRVGRKPLVIGGLLLMVPATALLGFATSLLQLSGYRLLQGAASAAIAAPGFALAADLATAGGEGRQMSIVTLGFGLGLATGPLLAGLLAVFFFELPFLVGGALSLVGAWIVYRWVPETVKRANS
ncbi:MAG: MFS transporter [Gemmatimonadota bacterium]|jgi:MFS family permease